MICDEEETTGSGSLDGWVGTGFSSHLRVGWNVPIGDFFFSKICCVCLSHFPFHTKSVNGRLACIVIISITFRETDQRVGVAAERLS